MLPTPVTQGRPSNEGRPPEWTANATDKTPDTVVALM